MKSRKKLFIEACQQIAGEYLDENKGHIISAKTCPLCTIAEKDFRTYVRRIYNGSWIEKSICDYCIFAGRPCIEHKTFPIKKSLIDLRKGIATISKIRGEFYESLVVKFNDLPNEAFHQRNLKDLVSVVTEIDKAVYEQYNKNKRSR